MVTMRVKPERLPGAAFDFDLDDANDILDLFELPRPAYAADFPDKGNISWARPPFARLTELVAAAAQFEPWQELLR